MLEISEIDHVDEMGLYRDYEAWPEHFLKAMQLQTDFSLPSKPVGVICAGMGGSGSSCDLVVNWATPNSKIPLIVWKDHDLPSFVGKDWVAIAVSLSGNTNETFSSLKAASKSGAHTIGISSGGMFEDFCGDNGIEYLKTPILKTPRSSLPYLAATLSKIFTNIEQLDVSKEDLTNTAEDMVKMRNEVGVNVNFGENPAKKLASEIYTGIPLIYVSPKLRPVATRFQDSLNENAKMHALVDSIPELCHNELESWRKTESEHYRTILLQELGEEIGIRHRFTFLRDLIESAGGKHYDVEAKGRCHFGMLFSTIYFLDYVSIYTAILRKVDPTPTHNIDRLKELLSSNY